MKLRTLTLALTMSAFMPWAQAQTAQSPKEGWYKHLVDYEYVKPHAELPKDMEVKGTVLLIDSRPAARRYDNGHIPTAINIPETQFDKLVGKLPADKATPIVFYCQGVECDLSHKSAFKAEALGYSNIKVYPGGQPDWEARGGLVALSLAYIKKLQDEKADMVLIDSRPERTFEKGTIPGAINISDSKFDKMTDKLPASKDTMLVFFCGGLKCDLSSKSAVKAKALGYKNVFIFPEGHPAWLEASGGAAAVAPAAGGTTAVGIEAGKEKGSISVASFERILKESPAQIVIIDVRDEKDVKKGTFPGAINIPVGDLEKKLGELPKDKPVVFTCSTGARSGEAYDTVKMLGGKDITAYFLDADVSFQGDGKYAIKGR